MTRANSQALCFLIAQAKPQIRNEARRAEKRSAFRHSYLSTTPSRTSLPRDRHGGRRFAFPPYGLLVVGDGAGEIGVVVHSIFVIAGWMSLDKQDRNLNTKRTKRTKKKSNTPSRSIAGCRACAFAGVGWVLTHHCSRKRGGRVTVMGQDPSYGQAKPLHVAACFPLSSSCAWCASCSNFFALGDHPPRRRMCGS